VKGMQLEVENVAFTGLASAMALLTNEQKELGALVIDLGAGTTEYVVYADGVIKHTGVLAVGGDHVSNDLAIGLKLPLVRAEQFKLEHGGAFVDDTVRNQTIKLASESGLSERVINLEHLRRIMSLRIEEIFQLIEQALGADGSLDHVRGGVLLCGGGARTPQIEKLAEQVFQLPSWRGRVSSINSLQSTLDQPEFAAAIGLVKFASMQQRREATRSLAKTVKDTFGQFFRRGG